MALATGILIDWFRAREGAEAHRAAPEARCFSPDQAVAE